jgi:hypothetical protein
LILNRVETMQKNLRQYLTTETDQLKTRLHTLLQGWEKDAKPNVQQINSQIGTSSVSSSQSGGSYPKQIYDTGGGYAQKRSFHSKVRDNAKNASAPLIPTTLPLTPRPRSKRSRICSRHRFHRRSSPSSRI